MGGLLGGICGVLGFIEPNAAGGGFGLIPIAAAGDFSVGLLLFLFFYKVPSASIGANIPPGAPEEKHSTVVMTREININSSRPTLKFPAAAMGISPKPPPEAFGSINPSTPHIPLRICSSVFTVGIRLNGC